MPDVLLGIIIAAIGVVSVIGFLVAMDNRDLTSVTASVVSFLFAIALMVWLISAANTEWKYITADAYANIKFNNATYTVAIYEDSGGHHVVELPYYLDGAKKYIIKIPDKDRYYKGILFVSEKPIRDFIKTEEIRAEK